MDELAQDLRPRRPNRIQFYFKTWTGRIILINGLIFLAMCFQGASLFLPSQEMLLRFGAKNDFAVLNGNYFALITPMFVHVGIVHFVLNMYGLRLIGEVIEHQIGGIWFLVAYLVTGLFGSIASYLFTFGVSAGASGAIFGVAGVGLVIERLYIRAMRKRNGTRLKRGPFTSLVVVNIILGFVLSFGPVRVDNSAHLGGLLSGCLFAVLLFSFKPNVFLKVSKLRAVSIAVLMAVCLAVGVGLVCSKDFYNEKIHMVIENENVSPQIKFEALTAAIDATSSDEYYFERGKLLAIDGQASLALDDFRSIKDKTLWTLKVNETISLLRTIGREHIASDIEAGLSRN